MTLSTKKVLASVLVASGLFLSFGVIAPQVAERGDAGGPLFGVLILIAISGVILARNTFGLSAELERD